MNYFHVYVINFPSFYSVLSVLYIFNISFSTSVLFSKRRISVNLVDLVKSFQTVFCSNFHFSVSLHVPFSQSLSNEYSIAKIGFDTAENGPLKVCQNLANRLKTSLNKHSLNGSVRRRTPRRRKRR